VDLSGSMQTRDMVLGGQAVSRFQAVNAIASDFIKRRQGDELGLVLFGSQAYLVTPLTYDLSAVSAQLDSSQIGIAGQQTAIGDAIAIATKRLMDLPLEQRVLVLLTDGVNTSGNLSPEDAASAAKAAGVRIYTIGIGANQLQVPGLFGSMTVNPSAELDTRLLTHIATETGGQFFRATDTASLADAYRAIDRLEPTKQQGEPVRLPQTGFRLPLAIGLGLLFLALLAGLFKRRPRQEKSP
jgi:Ca-activated chloride channel family protein